ncbi:hypothetical protein JTB14_007212 [Gonioctena quinquepunctata]|nr:hypothetical protein JTB14_007212 [Gonioctena quinquepunctata]
MESQPIGLLRIGFLKRLLQYREEDRPIIYLDGTYIHSSHSHERDGAMKLYGGTSIVHRFQLPALRRKKNQGRPENYLAAGGGEGSRPCHNTEHPKHRVVHRLRQQ